MNLSAEVLGPDIVNVSWNAKPFLKRGVQQFSLVAEPAEDGLLPIAKALVNVSDSSGVITNYLRPSTKYMIFIEENQSQEKQKQSKVYTIEYVRTAPGGESTKD